jgi:hypothetical protein
MTDAVRPRRKRRPDWRKRFLEIVAATGNVSLATSAVQISRSTPYVRAQRDPAFAVAWTEAEEQAKDVLEAEARRRGLTGSDPLLMFLLRALRPERYRDTLDVRVEFRKEAERVAAKLGRPVEEVIEDVTRRAEELRGR